MKKIFVLLAACCFFFSVPVYADETVSFWSAAIHAQGQDFGGVAGYKVILGISTDALTLPSPPAAPQYSVKMDLFTPEWELVFKDIRKEGESHYMWVIGIDPHGCIPPPFPRTSTISWDPTEFGAGYYELREGHDGTGEVVVADMKITTSYDVVGGQAVQYFIVVFTP